MWFAALSPRYAEPWFRELVRRLLAGDRAVLRLLGRNPFPDQPPRWIRARYYHYRFTTRAERLATGAWWWRDLSGEFLHPVTLAKSAGPGAARQSGDADGRV